MARATAAAVYGRCSMVARRKSSASLAPSRMASAALAAVSFACPQASCNAPSICLVLPCSWVFTSPVARPNPSSTWPPRFLALPVRRSSFMGVVLLRFATSTAGAGCRFPRTLRNAKDDPRDDPRDDLALAAQGKSLRRSSKLATAVRLLVLDLRSVASKPFHADAGGENADGQQWNELAPADGTAHLNGAAEDFGVEPGRVSTRRQCELGLFHRAATRPQTANGRDNRRQQEKTRERRGRGQRIVPLGQPDESDQENESGGHDPEYNGKERPDEKVGAETSLSSRP